MFQYKLSTQPTFFRISNVGTGRHYLFYRNYCNVDSQLDQTSEGRIDGGWVHRVSLLLRTYFKHRLLTQLTSEASQCGNG